MPVVRTGNCPTLSLVIIVLHFLDFSRGIEEVLPGMPLNGLPKTPFFCVMFSGNAKSWNDEFRRVATEIAVAAK